MIFFYLKILFILSTEGSSPPPPTNDCIYDGQVRLVSQYRIFETPDTPFEGVGGVIEICINGTYTRVCANDSFSSVDTEALSRLTCAQLGYPSEGILSIEEDSVITDCLYITEMVWYHVVACIVQFVLNYNSPQSNLIYEYMYIIVQPFPQLVSSTRLSFTLKMNVWWWIDQWQALFIASYTMHTQQGHSYEYAIVGCGLPRNF